MLIIDVLGKACPLPVIETKKALDRPDVPQVLVLVDNSIAVQNLERLADSMNCNFSVSEAAKNRFEVTITKACSVADAYGIQPTQQDAAPARGPVVVISRDEMGGGAEELGKILIKGFVYSLTEISTPPESVIFLNSGAYLTAEGSNTVSDLQKLEQMGAKILTCGTCINFYELQGKLAVGAVANMYEIAQQMAGAVNVINI